MGILFIENSEARKGTRLPQNVISAARVLNGLEETTGADILLSPLSMPIHNLNAIGLLMLKRHIEAGILIQRKSGRDAVNSIPNLPSIQERMRVHTKYPLLIIVGQYTSNKE